MLTSQELAALAALCGHSSVPSTAAPHAASSLDMQGNVSLNNNMQNTMPLYSNVQQTYLPPAIMSSNNSGVGAATTTSSALLAGNHPIAMTGGGIHVNYPDPNAEARAIAANILIAHHRQQQQQQQQQAQQQYSLPGTLALNQTPQAVPSAALGPPAQQLNAQAVPSWKPQLHLPVARAAAALPPSKVPPKKVKKVPHKKKVPDRRSPSKSRPPPKKRAIKAISQQGDNSSYESVVDEWEDKKEAKRAANRISAHLSRKRKKMFIDDLKRQNEELRYRENILLSVPDLVIVFDSSGRMPFVSPSVKKFIHFKSDELQDTSLWDRLTPRSVQLVKRAFMDALATGLEVEDSVPLWDGEPRTVKLLDRNGADTKSVALKGIVHFAGEAPECVCTIRPEYLDNRRRSTTPDSHRVSDNETTHLPEPSTT